MAFLFPIVRVLQSLAVFDVARRVRISEANSDASWPLKESSGASLPVGHGWTSQVQIVQGSSSDPFFAVGGLLWCPCCSAMSGKSAAFTPGASPSLWVLLSVHRTDSQVCSLEHLCMVCCTGLQKMSSAWLVALLWTIVALLKASGSAQCVATSSSTTSDPALRRLGMVREL